MNKFAINIFPLLISILFILFSFSCSNELTNGDLDYKKLEYHGYIFIANLFIVILFYFALTIETNIIFI